MINPSDIAISLRALYCGFAQLATKWKNLYKSFKAWYNFVVFFVVIFAYHFAGDK